MSGANGNGKTSGNGNGKTSAGNGNGNGGNGDALARAHMGRGRGRAALPEQRLSDTTESDSGKRQQMTQERSEPSKRGKTREDRSMDKVEPHTRPEHIDANTKKGTQGTQMQLETNYFKLRFKPGMKFRQYRVDFQPDVEDIRIRKALIYQNNEKLGAYIYDGQNLVYVTRQLETTEFLNETREGTKHKVIFKDVNVEIEFTTAMGVMVLNTILRRSMDGLKLQLVNRNLFDPKNPIDFRDFKLQLWPGYITSIRQMEDDVLICCEISHKVMRQETVLDILSKYAQEGGDYKTKFEQEVCNTVVLTDYNNNTYSICAVQWDMTPSSTFKVRDGEKSFMQYYKERYNLNLRDARQPLLVTRLTARDVRGGRTEPALLVPELCRTTGLTDQMRNNFNMMKALGEYTRMSPNHRVDRLLKFAQRLKDTPESKSVMDKFGVKMEPNLMVVQSRLLAPEQIRFGDNKLTLPDSKTADWTPALRNNSMFSSEVCTKWVLMYPRRAAEDTDRFLNMMMEVSNGLKFQMQNPKRIELADDRTGTYARELQEICKKDPKLIMIVLMGKNKRK